MVSSDDTRPSSAYIFIKGIIPNGDTFVINPPSGPTEYDWTADVYNGTSIIFAMADSQGRQGGSSDVKDCRDIY